MSFEMSPTVSKLFEALAAAQAELVGPKKDSVNPHFKSKYADLESVVEASRKVLPKHGLCVTQVRCGGTKDGIELVTVLGHKSGEWIRGTSFTPMAKPDAQGAGSAITYARRYDHCAIIGIAPEDDDGNAASEPRPQHGPLKAPVATSEQLAGALAASTDMMGEVVQLNERIAVAATMGTLNELWRRVGELKLAGLPASHYRSLAALKDKRKGELQPVNGAA
jgi:hypothetical protein